MAYSIYAKDRWNESKPLPIVFTEILATNNTTKTDGFEWTPEYWTCDPCARSCERYTIKHTYTEFKHAWWEVIIVGYDSDKEIECKIEHYKKVLAAREVLNNAEHELNKLIK